ncbi:MAG: hypothetical protein FWD40_11730 [Treponema sp.]|nr:hypothetical protein [Treponema sp.]
MKKYAIISIFITIIFVLAASPVFSQEENYTIGDLNAGADAFSSAIAKALPFYSTLGLNWSDAYIGQLLDVPPKFGVGLSFGAISMPAGSLNDLAKVLNFNLPSIKIGFPLPAYALEARVGGIFLPFDIGLKYGIVPENQLLDELLDFVNIRYQLMGADIRYAIITSKVMPIRLSVGLGFNRLEGGISKTLNMGQAFDFGINTLEVTDPNVGLLWETNTIEIKAQVSFPLVLITPYAGLGVSHAWSKAGYQVKSEVLVDGDPVTAEYIQELRELGLTGISGSGFERVIESTALNARLFGGISFNLLFIKLDLTAMYNVMDSSIGGSFGVRFQL